MAITLRLNSYYVSAPIVFVNGTRLYYGYTCNAGDVVEYRFKKLSDYTYSEVFSLDNESITITGLEEGDREDGYHYVRFTADETWDGSTLAFTIDIIDKSSFKTLTISMSPIESVTPWSSANLLIEGNSYALNNNLVPVGQPVEVNANMSNLDFVFDFDKLNESNTGVTESDITSITFGLSYYNEKYSTDLRFHFIMPNNDVTFGADFKVATACEVKTYVDETPYLATAYGLVGRLLGDFRANNVLNRRPTKEGYTFKGWYTDAELTTQATEGTVLPSEGLNLYAKFGTVTSTHTVTFKEGDETIATVQVDDAQRVMPIEPLHSTDASGNEFVYWALNNVEYDFTTPVESDITLVAVYAKAGSSKWIMSLPNCYVGLKSDVADLPKARVADGTKALAISANAGEETAYIFHKASLTWIELQHYTVNI